MSSFTGVMAVVEGRFPSPRRNGGALVERRAGGMMPLTSPKRRLLWGGAVVAFTTIFAFKPLGVLSLPAAVGERTMGMGGEVVVSNEDPFFKSELDNSTYREEKTFLELKEKTGNKTLFAPEGGTFNKYVDTPPEAELELARLQLRLLGEPTDVVDVGAQRLAALSEKYAVLNFSGSGINSDGKAAPSPSPSLSLPSSLSAPQSSSPPTPQSSSPSTQPTSSAPGGEGKEEGENKEWVNVAGTGSLWNLQSLRTFCPEVVRFAVARMRGISRVFRLPTLLFYSIGVASRKKKDNAVISNDVSSSSPSGGEGGQEELKAPIGPVLRMPAYCFIRFIWREKRYDLMQLEVDEVKEDEEKKAFVETGKKIRAYLPVESTDERLKSKMGHFRFLEILEQRAHHPERPLQEFLDDEVQRKIKTKCLSDQAVVKRQKEEALVEGEWTLRRCFFEMDREVLLQIMGHQQWETLWGKPLGVTSTWNKGVEVYPNAVYLRVCLCGAMKVSKLVKEDFLTASYMYDHKTTLKEWLLSGKGSLEIPNDKPIPAAYAMARDCSADEILADVVGEATNSQQGRLRQLAISQPEEDLRTSHEK